MQICFHQELISGQGKAPDNRTPLSQGCWACAGDVVPPSIQALRSEIFYHAQVVVVTDGALANTVLGRALSLDKALEPNLSDELLSIGGHRTMFSAGEASPEVMVCPTGTSRACSLGTRPRRHCMYACNACLYEPFLDRYQVCILATAPQGHSGCFQSQSCEVCQELHATSSHTCNGHNS